jgi:hypothetical protein
MLITTTPNIEGKWIKEYLGIVTGEAVVGANLFRDLFAGIRDIVGGRSGAYEKELRKARNLAFEEITAMRANFRPSRSSHGPYVCITAIQASTIYPTSRWARPLDKVLSATLPPSAACNLVCSVSVRISPRSFSVRII